MVYWRVAAIKLRPNPSANPGILSRKGLKGQVTDPGIPRAPLAIKRRTAARHPNRLDCYRHLSQYANCSLSNRLGLLRFHGGHIAEDRGALPAVQWLQDFHPGSIGHPNGTAGFKVPVQKPGEEAFTSLKTENGKT